MTDITLAQAREIVRGSIAAAREMGLPPLTVVVLDRSGNPVAMEREDGATMFRLDVATGKAWGAVGFSCSSRTLAKRAKGNPNFFLTLSATGKGKFLPQPGAVVIRDDRGQILGAVGASGATGDEDEAACASGVKRAGLNPGVDIA
eukprot:CAMPEP_0201507826 /NCGR_PEP_ID=MMETSP0161_2-20130828/1372_1 /ASSEMBLY_ACC=CAM_ASM_000251 /TAXON_ID=180227 /ORGANISM="Neoparamoeba aestuarina, Strain SoJaBio B1-5/56/2" /LENGTH=145 /DNA_ID=CAMNT_0047902297 /DNA_START=23 /DNA_END=456 /DNA_ORIENTATION=-